MISASRRDSKCINVRLASTFRDKVYPGSPGSASVLVNGSMHAIPWTVPDAEPGYAWSDMAPTASTAAGGSIQHACL